MQTLIWTCRASHCRQDSKALLTQSSDSPFLKLEHDFRMYLEPQYLFFMYWNHSNLPNKITKRVLYYLSKFSGGLLRLLYISIRALKSSRLMDMELFFKHLTFLDQMCLNYILDKIMFIYLILKLVKVSIKVLTQTDIGWLDKYSSKVFLPCAIYFSF